MTLLQRWLLSSALIGVGLVFSMGVQPAAADGDAPPSIRVNCNRAESIAQALGQQPEAPRLTIIVKGVCHENVAIGRGGLTLLADPSGGGISAPDAATDAVHVTADDVTIDGLSVTGGRSGVGAFGARRLTLRHCTVQNAARSGVVFLQSNSGLVDGCTVQTAGRDGIVLDGATATIINSTISQNTRAGIVVGNGSSGRIGLDNLTGPAGNTIGPNGSAGLLIAASSATVAANTISGNGTDPAALFGQAGVVLVTGAQATFPGGNTISGNAGTGIFTRSSSLLMGNVNPDLGTTLNTISGNGGASSTPHGIELFLNSSADLRNAVVNGNVGNGILASTNSSTILTNVTVTNNTLDGIQLVFGGALFLTQSLSTSADNARFGLNCLDAESSVFGSLNLFGNGVGDVSPTCTGF
jgi:Right handed beta helix region